ncbi:polysaccharide biosynthesis C-terminal domain-containing protein [Nocardiopsis composta]|uniref:O-antigen/teichoic acid export membrane protein n=2 Tax=Nocardiopsis composta TaxID=157465 RepID=A0A7W8QQ14_9ACTN|nr:polysaccharide biosynthesis C-terminal domain-containing protein [Nocardiopsis composta]MBB5434480.1 O-antigen/teichoic acid export membrane protein [Nocardiopsis composta]
MSRERTAGSGDRPRGRAAGSAEDGGGRGPGGGSIGKVARGGAVNMAAAVAGAALNLGVVVAVARGFDQGSAGLLFSATSVFLIASAVAGLGTGSGLVYFLARLRALGAPEHAPRLLRTALGPVSAAALAGSAALLAAADPLARLIGEPGAADHLRLLAAFLPFAVVTDAVLAATRAYHAMRPTALLDKVGRPLAQLLLIGAVAGTGSGALLALGWAGPYLPAAVLACLWLHRIMRAAPAPEPPAGPAPPPDGAAGASRVGAREFWGFSLPRSAAAVAQIAIQRSGIILVAAVQGAAAAAVFTAGTRIMVAGQFAAQAVQFAAGTRLAELLAYGDRAEAGRLYQVSTAWLICLTWPLFLPAIAYAPLVMAVFGDGYGTPAGVGVLVVISAAQLGSAALGMGDLLLTMAGRTFWNLANNVLALAANVVLCLLLVPAAGPVGAALAWAAAIAVRNLLPLVQLRRTLGVHPFSRRWAAAAAAALLWFGAVPGACAALLGTGPGSLTAALALGGAGWLYTLWRLRRLLELDGLLPRRLRTR